MGAAALQIGTRLAYQGKTIYMHPQKKVPEQASKTMYYLLVGAVALGLLAQLLVQFLKH